MGYSTIFEGNLQYELDEPYLKALTSLSEELRREIAVSATSLTVNGEWQDRGLMEKMALFIEQHGKLISGSIICFGEDPKDVWEIKVVDEKACLIEIGTVVTLNRTYSKLNTN